MTMYNTVTMSDYVCDCLYNYDFDYDCDGAMLSRLCPWIHWIGYAYAYG